MKVTWEVSVDDSKKLIRKMRLFQLTNVWAWDLGEESHYDTGGLLNWFFAAGSDSDKGDLCITYVYIIDTSTIAWALVQATKTVLITIRMLLLRLLSALEACGGLIKHRLLVLLPESLIQ